MYDPSRTSADLAPSGASTVTLVPGAQCAASIMPIATLHSKSGDHTADVIWPAGFAVHGHRPGFDARRHGFALYAEAADLTGRAVLEHGHQRIPPDAVDRLDRPAEAAEAAFVRRVLPRHVAAVGEQARFDPLDDVRAAGAHVQVFARRHQRIPQRLAVFATVDVDLKASLFGVARACDDKVATLETQLLEAEEFYAAHDLAEHARHQVVRLRSLNPERRDVRFEDTGVKRHAMG